MCRIVRFVSETRIDSCRLFMAYWVTDGCDDPYHSKPHHDSFIASYCLAHFFFLLHSSRCLFGSFQCRVCSLPYGIETQNLIALLLLSSDFGDFSNCDCVSHHCSLFACCDKFRPCNLGSCWRIGVAQGVSCAESDAESAEACTTTTIVLIHHAAASGYCHFNSLIPRSAYSAFTKPSAPFSSTSTANSTVNCMQRIISTKPQSLAPSFQTFIHSQAGHKKARVSTYRPDVCFVK